MQQRLLDRRDIINRRYQSADNVFRASNKKVSNAEIAENAEKTASSFLINRF